MRTDPLAEARRLLGQVGSEWLADLAVDPATTIEVLFEPISVDLRPPSPSGSGCSVDGTYNPGPPPRIVVADDVVPARRRFSILHELGHHLIENDEHLNDLAIPDADRRDEEICNEVAAQVLLPPTVVDDALPAGRFTAEQVAALHQSLGTTASRMACCVAAVRRLGSPGCVILGSADGTAEFVAHQPATPWRIARGTAQGDDSLLALAARSADRRARGVTRARFANGNFSGPLHGDVFVAEDDWVYAVLVADSHSPWQTGGLNFGIDIGREAVEFECPSCDDVHTVWGAPCRRCGDYRCPSCGRCSCPSGPPTRRCSGPCGLMKPENQFPLGGPICIDCVP